MVDVKRRPCCWHHPAKGARMSRAYFRRALAVLLVAFLATFLGGLSAASTGAAVPASPSRTSGTPKMALTPGETGCTQTPVAHSVTCDQGLARASVGPAHAAAGTASCVRAHHRARASCVMARRSPKQRGSGATAHVPWRSARCGNTGHGHGFNAACATRRSAVAAMAHRFAVPRGMSLCQPARLADAGRSSRLVRVKRSSHAACPTRHRHRSSRDDIGTNSTTAVAPTGVAHWTRTTQ